jgi:hypothetical protein
MKINSKDYKINLVKTLFKSKKVILFGHSPFKNTSKWLKLEQFLKTNKCLSYRIPNKLLKVSLKNNIFRFLTNWVNGPILVIELNDPTLFNQINKEFKVAAIKIDNKIYTSFQFINIKNLSYKNSVKSFLNNLNYSTKNLSIKLTQVDKSKSE